MKYAIIDNGVIVGGASDLEVAQFAVSGTSRSFAEAPDDFTTHDFKFANGLVVRKTQADFDNELATQLVLTNRKFSYPSIEDQLDTLYHGGYDAWKAQVEAVKLKFPKPE